MRSLHLTAYGRIRSMLAAGECVVLDGGVATEVARTPFGRTRDPEASRDTWAIYDRTNRVLGVHRRYASAGCDVISTNTWGLLHSAVTDRGRRPGRTGLPAWTVATRDAVTLARRGISEAGRSGQCAVAFSLNDADPLFPGVEELLTLLWSIDPPDLVLVETLSELPSPDLVCAIADVAARGLPVWVSFNCIGADAETTPGSVSSALAELERSGVDAVLVNCVPAAQTSTALAQLAMATSLPVGCYPRLDGPLHPAAYAELCLEWRAQGARILGGCCGVGPRHIEALSARLAARAMTSS